MPNTQRPEDPGRKITSLDELLTTIRGLKSTATYSSRPRPRRHRNDDEDDEPNPLAHLDGKTVTSLHVDSELSVSMYDWYHSFSLLFAEEDESFTKDENGNVTEVRGCGRLSFLGHQKVFYTAIVESFVLTNADGGDGKFNLRITSKPETTLGRYKGIPREEAEALRRTNDVVFEARVGVWPNSNGYCEYNYSFRLDLERSPYPQEAQQLLTRLPEAVWEKRFFGKAKDAPYK